MLAQTLGVTKFIIVTKSYLDVQQTHLRGQFVEQKLMLAQTLGVTKFIIVTDMIWVTLCWVT
jgi:hypothetical protein